jgi:hypothetical protein
MVGLLLGVIIGIWLMLKLVWVRVRHCFIVRVRA